MKMRETNMTIMTTELKKLDEQSELVIKTGYKSS
jgi:hypothetical protein